MTAISDRDEVYKLGMEHGTKATQHNFHLPAASADIMTAHLIFSFFATLSTTQHNTAHSHVMNSLKKKIVLIARLAKFHGELALISYFVVVVVVPLLDRYIITKHFWKETKKIFHLFNCATSVVAVMKSSNWNSSTTRFLFILQDLFNQENVEFFNTRFKF